MKQSCSSRRPRCRVCWQLHPSALLQQACHTAPSRAGDLATAGTGKAGSCRAEARHHRPGIRRRWCHQATLTAPAGWLPPSPDEAPRRAWPPPGPGLRDGRRRHGLCRQRPVLPPQYCDKFNPLLLEGRKDLQLKGKAYFSCHTRCILRQSAASGVQRGRGPGQAEAPGPGAAVRCGAVLLKRLKGDWGVLPTGHLLANTPHQYTGLAKRAIWRRPQILPCFLCACFSAWGDCWAAEARCRPSTTPVRYRPGWILCIVWLILSSSPSPHCSFYFCLENLFVKLEVVLTKSVAGQNTGGNFLIS